MKSDNQQPNAGSAEPSWFEWLHGLVHVVELLDPDSTTKSVAFQLTGVKGWDDVGVRYEDGTVELMQMKHSRVGDTLTFSDLVSHGAGEKSLLGSLAQAWSKIRIDFPSLRCVLVTNRLPGNNWHQHRPPLQTFLDALQRKLAGVRLINEVTWSDEEQAMIPAWAEFVEALQVISGNEVVFLSSLEIRLAGDDLRELAAKLDQRLIDLTGLPSSSISEVRNALISQLRIWTCHTQRPVEWIDGDELRKVLIGEESPPNWSGHCDVETPEPFFSSRETVINDMRIALSLAEGPSHYFLSAEPGSGKTSCISKLVRDAPLRWQDQVVSLRYYAYRPIVPGRADIGSDSGIGATPEALWLGLLWQLRQNLRRIGILTECRAPAWIHGLAWHHARDHVLRIASLLAKKWHRSFTIAIDGIDHAARAKRKGMKEFLSSLPGPDSVPSGVRLLFAGQPVDAYPEYPTWLKSKHKSVRKFTLEELPDPDIEMLWRAKKTTQAEIAMSVVVQLLVLHGKRRTLPTVYAIEDIAGVSTLAEGEAILKNRHLSDSLHDYYNNIWTYAVGGERSLIEPSLAAVFVLLRERPTAQLMALAFPEWNKSIAEWEQHLRHLRPLIRETPKGYEPVHNDLRVYLDGRLAGDPDSRKQASSRLADYYRSPYSDKLFAHRTLLFLLKEAGRGDEFADVFDTDWVIESGVVDVVDDELGDQCHAAFCAACRRKDWVLLHRVACASLTVNKLQECIKNSGSLPTGADEQPMPFLPKEGDTLAVELWTRSDIEEVIDTAHELATNCYAARARTILQQWFGERSVIEIAKLAQLVTPDSERVEGIDSHYDPSGLFRKWGRLAGKLDLTPPFGDDDIQALDDLQRKAVSAFEGGWAEEWSSIENRKKALRRWVQVGPLYLQSWANAIQGAAKCERWSEVRGLMKRLATNVSGFGIEEQLNFAWIALRGNLPETSPWLDVARGSSFNFPDGLTLLNATKFARIVGYRDLLREPAQVSEDLAKLLDRRHYRPQYQTSSRIILRGATVLGRLWRYVDRNDPEVATTVPIRDLQPLLNALWLERPDWRTVDHEDINLGPHIGAELASAIWRSKAYDTTHQIAMARSVFNRFWGMASGLQAFNMLFEAKDSDWLERCVEKLVEETISSLHEQSYNDRVEAALTLIGFAERLGDSVSATKLESCSKRTRIGYSGHKEWVFRPLSSWLEFLVERNPDEWKKSGLRMLRLDRLCNAQHGESGFSDELITILGAGAIMAGNQHLAYLWERLESHNKRWGNLWVLTKAVRDGFVHVLKSKHPLSNEVVQSLTALCVGLGRWPKESAVAVIDSLQCEFPPEHPHQATLSQIRVIAADYYPHNIVKEPSDGEPHGSPSIGSAKPPLTSDEILRQSNGDSFYDGFRLATIAQLGQALSDEKRADRAVKMNEALNRFNRSDALNRCLDPHEERLMTSISRHLTNDEQWKLLEGITAVTGPLRSRLNDEPWGHMVAFTAVDLLCQALAKNGSADLGRQAAEHLLKTHEAWAAHPSFKEALDPAISHVPIQWRDTARELLLRLLESDACETVYSAMSGLRLLAEMYPQQIPVVVRHGLKSVFKQEVVLSLSEIWACRFPEQMKAVQNDLKTASEEIQLDQQIQAWITNNLRCFSQTKAAHSFVVPAAAQVPMLRFPGDDGLLADNAQINGLERYNSFASITNERFVRLEHILGSLKPARRVLAVKFKNGDLKIPDFIMKAPTFLAIDGMTPRSKHEGDLEFGQAVTQQFSNMEWSPDKAGAVRSALGGGIDPWVATTSPALWSNKSSWPSYSDIEKWAQSGFHANEEVALRLRELVSGTDLPNDEIVLGSVLDCPTYMRDLKFWYWLEAPQRSSPTGPKNASTTMSSKTFAGFFGGWISGAREADTSVHFSGALMTFPNVDLEVTPTNDWLNSWGWIPVVRNPLRWMADNGTQAARYEQWLQADGYTASLRISRQSILRRWVAKKAAIPAELDGLASWRRRVERFNGLLRKAE